MNKTLVNRKSEIVNGDWLPDMDLNHDKQIQSLLCYRYTIGQSERRKPTASPLPVKPSNRVAGVDPKS
jgi:hypothetical protein